MAPNQPSVFALTAAAMREADRRTIEDLGIPGHTLMETAARATVAAMEDRFGPLDGRRIVVLCGRGNNGGDGLVAARVLLARGATVRVALFAPSDDLDGDAGLNYRILREVASAYADRFEWLDANALPEPTTCDVVVDALLGTGLSSPPRPPLDAAVRWMNAGNAPVVCVDLPTGLHTDTGRVLGEAVRGTLTVTMATPKTGLILAEGPEHAGRLVVADIGIPAHVIRAVSGAPGCAVLTSDRWVRALLDSGSAASSKFTTGPTLVVGGSRRYAAAPVMSALAAARAGSGYVVCATPDAAEDRVTKHLLEIPYVGLSSDEAGFADGSAAAADLAEGWDRERALLIGPGLGRTDGVRAFVREVLEDRGHPAVVDADGLNAIDAEYVRKHANGLWILTPHEAEFSRLGGPDDDRSPVERAAEAARAWNAVVLLKGLPSVVAAPDGRVVICGTGSRALATAGSGDVLAGLCAGMLARGLRPFEAAVCGLHLGGAAADRYTARSGRSSMMATDLIRQVGPVLRDRFEAAAAG